MYVYVCILVHASSSLSYNQYDNPEYFGESLSISHGYLKMIAELDSILSDCDLSNLKSVLIHQVHTPGGIKLKKCLKDQIKSKIEAATSSSHLISVLDDFPFCNWLDTRLIEALTIGSKLKSSTDLVSAYKKFLFRKKFHDALLEFPMVPEEEIEAFVIAVSEKIQVDPDEITIGHFMKKQRIMSRVILDLMNQTLIIKHVGKGCLEFSYYISAHYSINAYKMALYNRYKFCTVDLIHIKIGKQPMIYCPWSYHLDKKSTKQMLNTQHEGV